MFAVDVDGVFRCCQCALPHMIREKAGVIVNIASMWGQTGASCEVHYSAAKAAVIGLTRALAKELGPSGIRVNCVSPGVIDTKMNAPLGPGTMEALREETPLCRIGTPEDVAEAVAFLAGEGARFITGQVLGRERRLRGLTRPVPLFARKASVSLLPQQSAPPPPAHRPARGSAFILFYSDKAQSELHALGEPIVQILNLHALLLHGVAVAHSDAVVGRLALGLVAHGVEVDRDAVRRADLILAAVALADGTGVVEVHHEIGLERVIHFARLAGELFRERKHGSLERGQRRVQVQHDAHVVLFGVHNLLVIRLAEEGEGHAVAAEEGSITYGM